MTDIESVTKAANSDKRNVHIWEILNSYYTWYSMWFSQ